MRIQTANAILFALLLHSLADADSITVDGQRLDNVLVTKTSSFYYVQIPSEGRTLSIPLENVDASSIEINIDPFYRDDLQAEYKENLQRRETQLNDPDLGGTGEQSAVGAGAPASSAGGGSSAGLGVARTDIETALAGFGLTFQPGPGRNGQPSVVAQMPDGSRVELLGPPERLHGVVASGVGAPAQVKMMMQQLGMLVMQLQPAAANVMPALVQEAEQSGNARRSVGGVTLSLTQSMQGQNAAVEFSMIAGG